ncbi:MAG: bifunctional nuclease family protein [Myxococcales bacterium]|nr:bifunctional nuclease family protein [Myxococcales bacterium]
MKSQRVYHEFTVRGLAIDPKSGLPVLLLVDLGGRLVLPISIGSFEASAIMGRIEGRRPTRPMTHDLLRLVILRLGATMTGLDIRGIEGGIFLGNLHLRLPDGRTDVIDCRPSDGIALAVRFGVPIRVAASVLDAAQPMPERDAQRAQFVADDDDEGRARLAALLADMAPEDFGEFEM